MIEATRGGSVGGDGFITSSPRFLLPFADENTNNWTEEIFAIYYQVQVAVGLKKEPTEQEIKAQELLEHIDEAIETGGNWLDEVKNFFGDDDEEFDLALENEEVMDSIVQELRDREEVE